MIRSPKMIVSALLVLAVGAFFATSNKAQKLSKVKSAEEYWSETGISPGSLEELLQDGSCRSSERYFLACVNAVQSVAQKYGYNVTTKGTLEPLKDSVSSQNLTEKELLAPWKALIPVSNQIPPFSFLSIWKQIVRKAVQPRQLSAAVGVGMNGFLSVFRDPHTYLMPADLYREVVAKATYRSLSLGIILGKGAQHYFIKKVIDSSPSQRAGLKRGDFLLSVNGQKVDKMSTVQVSDLLRGEAGSLLKLTILRNKDIHFVQIIRAENRLPSVSFQVIEGLKPVGVLTINKFATDTCALTSDALVSMKEQDIRGLLLDLRDNPGGQMDEAACVVSLFVGPGKKAFQIENISSVEENETVYTTEAQVYSGAMAILINAGSASAAEIVAGALQDYKRGLLVGERTFGKGSFQEGEVWSKNKKIALFETKGFYYLPSGRTPQMRGLTPDVEVAFTDRIALREEDQFVNALMAPEKVPAAKVLTAKADLSACISFDTDLIPEEDIELKQAHRALNCLGRVGER